MFHYDGQMFYVQGVASGPNVCRKKKNEAQGNLICDFYVVHR
jgi:hypothetical protein